MAIAWSYSDFNIFITSSDDKCIMVWDLNKFLKLEENSSNNANSKSGLAKKKKRD